MHSFELKTTKTSFLDFFVVYTLFEENQIYGINAKKYSSDNKVLDEANINEFTNNKELALDFFNLIEKYKVTPMTLYEIAYDFLVSKQSV